MGRRLFNEIEVRDHGALAWHPLDALVRGLAELDARPFHVVSLYLDARWDDEQQRERARLTLKNALAEERERLRAGGDEPVAAALRDLDRAEEYALSVIKQRRDVGFEGIAGFFAERSGLDLVILSHAPMPTFLAVATRAHLSPLVRCASDFDLALVAVVETDETRILEIAMGGLLGADTVEGNVPDRVQRGGWRQLRIQKHIADHIAQHHRDAARDLMARFDAVSVTRGRPPRVVLGGREPMLSAFERHLPERILRHAIRAPHIDPALATEQVLGHVREAIDQAQARSDREVLAAVADAAAIGRGAVGVEAVLGALNEGRLRELVVDRRFSTMGTRCTRCDQLLEGQPDRGPCPACGGEVEPVALLEEIVRRAVLHAAEVRTVESDGRQLAWDGVAATLRY